MTNDTTDPRYLVDENGCWVWQMTRVHNGYGRTSVGGGRSRSVYAHRLYYERAHGPIPEGMQLDHLCRNRACVNPAHMEVVTNRENVQRGAWPKLNAEKVRVTRMFLVAGISKRAIGRYFSVSKSCIDAVASGKTWSNIQ